MAGRFLPQRDVDLITRVSRELVGDKQNSKDGIINQTVVIYKPSLQESSTNMYGEAANGTKIYKNGVQLAALVDADLIIVDDGAGGTNRKATLSRLMTYVDANSSGITMGKAIAAAIVFG